MPRERIVRRLRARPRLRTRYRAPSVPPGEQAQVDWASFGWLLAAIPTAVRAPPAVDTAMVYEPAFA